MSASTARSRQPLLEQAAAAGIKIVGWHAGPSAGPVEGIPAVFTNVTTDPIEVATSAGLRPSSNRAARPAWILFTESIYAIATAKTNAERAAVGGLQGLQGARSSPTRRSPTFPTGWVSSRRRCFRSTASGWTHSIAVNDSIDFSAPSLQAAGVDPASGFPQQISAGDGSVPAFKRIRDKQYQIATVAEPLNLQGWIMIDEINRAFAGEKPSGYVPHVHCSRRQHRQGRRQGKQVRSRQRLRDEYKKIWGVEVKARASEKAQNGRQHDYRGLPRRPPGSRFPEIYFQRQP